MAAFDRILSGVPEMDKTFDHIRLGDRSDDGNFFKVTCLFCFSWIPWHISL